MCVPTLWSWRSSTGYSCLLSLRRLPIGTVKLDRAFVAGLGRHHADRAIVTAMVQLAHALGMRACAEGVERYEQLDRLGELGCDLAQGYLLGRPMPGPAFAALVAAGDRGAARKVPRRGPVPAGALAASGAIPREFPPMGEAPRFARA